MDLDDRTRGGPSTWPSCAWRRGSWGRPASPTAASPRLAGGALGGAAEDPAPPVPLDAALPVRRRPRDLGGGGRRWLAAEARPQRGGAGWPARAGCRGRVSGGGGGRRRPLALLRRPVLPGCFVCGPARARRRVADLPRRRPAGEGCGRRRGRRTRPSRARTARSGRRWSGRRWTAPAGSPPPRWPTCPPTPRSCSAGWPPAWAGCPGPATTAAWSPGRWPRRPQARRQVGLLGPDGEVLAAARTVWITVARHTVVAGGAAS